MLRALTKKVSKVFNRDVGHFQSRDPYAEYQADRSQRTILEEPEPEQNSPQFLATLVSAGKTERLGANARVPWSDRGRNSPSAHHQEPEFCQLPKASLQTRQADLPPSAPQSGDAPSPPSSLRNIRLRATIRGNVRTTPEALTIPRGDSEVNRIGPPLSQTPQPEPHASGATHLHVGDRPPNILDDDDLRSWAALGFQWLGRHPARQPGQEAPQIAPLGAPREVPKEEPKEEPKEAPPEIE